MVTKEHVSQISPGAKSTNTATEAVVLRELGTKELRPLFTEAETEEAFDIKLRTEYLEALDVLEVVEATDFVSQSSTPDMAVQPATHGARFAARCKLRTCLLHLHVQL